MHGMEELTLNDFISKLKKASNFRNGKKDVVGFNVMQEKRKLDNDHVYMHTYFTVNLADEKGKIETIRIDKE